MSKANHKNEEPSSPYSDSPEFDVSLSKSLTIRYNIDDLASSLAGVESSQTGGNKCAVDAEQKMDISLITEDCCNNHHSTELTSTVKSLPEVQELVTTNSLQASHELNVALRSLDDTDQELTTSTTDVHFEAQTLNCVSSPQIQPTLTSETDWAGYNIDDLAPSPVGVESSQTGGNKCAVDAEQKMDISLITEDCCNNHHSTELTSTVKSLPEVQELVTTNSLQASHELNVALRSLDDTDQELTTSTTDVHLEAQTLNCVSSPQIQPTLTSETDWAGDTAAPWPVRVESSQTEEDQHAFNTRKIRNTSCITEGYYGNRHHIIQEMNSSERDPLLAIHTSALTIRSPLQNAQKSTTCFSNLQTKQPSVTDQESTFTSVKAGSEDDLLMGKQTLQTQPTLTSATDWIERTEDCLAPRYAIVETSLMQDDKHAIDTEKEIDTSHIIKGKLPRTITSNQKPPYSKQEDIGDLSTGGNICVKQKCYFKTKNRSMLMKILFSFILAPASAQLQGNSSPNSRTVPVGTTATIYCIFNKDVDTSEVGQISLQRFNEFGSPTLVIGYFGRGSEHNFERPGYAVDYNKTNGTTLAVSINATSEEHEGTYECQAENAKLKRNITTIPSKLIVTGHTSINESNSTSSILTIDRNASKILVAVAVVILLVCWCF